MDVVEVIFREETFEAGIIFEVEIIVIEWIEIGKIGEHGDNPGQEKEIEIDKVGHHLVLDRDQGLVQIEIGLDVSNVESMTTLPMNVLPLVTYTKILPFNVPTCGPTLSPPTAQQWVSMCIRLICDHLDHLEVLVGIEMV